VANYKELLLNPA